MSKYTVDALSLSHIGDLLRDRLGDDASQYLFPDDFEKAVVDIGFKGIVYDGSSAPYDVTVIGKVDLSRALTSGWSGDENGIATITFIGVGNDSYAVPAGMCRQERSLTSVALPVNTTSIGNDAFNGCSSLVSLTGLNNVASVAPGAFSNVILTEISLPNCTSVTAGSFNTCKAKRIILPKIPSLNYGNLFSNCTALEYLQLGSVGHPIGTTVSNNSFSSVTQTSLVIDVYVATSSDVNTLITNLRSKVTGATINVKASTALTYNNVSYAAGDTVVTSTPS